MEVKLARPVKYRNDLHQQKEGFLSAAKNAVQKMMLKGRKQRSFIPCFRGNITKKMNRPIVGKNGFIAVVLTQFYSTKNGKWV
jgi:hypothetical protein